MRTWLVGLVLVIATGATPSALDQFRVTDNHRRIEVYITVPDGTVTMLVEVECDHVLKSDGREVRFRQERFDFRDLHADQYGLVAVFRDGRGKETAITRQVFVTD